jgi:hypothetical protein
LPAWLKKELVPCLLLVKVTARVPHLLPRNWVRVFLPAGFLVLTIHPCPSSAALLQTWPPA